MLVETQCCAMSLARAKNSSSACSTAAMAPSSLGVLPRRLWMTWYSSGRETMTCQN